MPSAPARRPLPPFSIDAKENRIGPQRHLTDREWDRLIAVMKERGITALDAGGLMTDDVLARIAALDHVTSLSLGGSRQLTDDGLRHLARMPQLRAARSQRVSRRPADRPRSRRASPPVEPAPLRDDVAERHDRQGRRQPALLRSSRGRQPHGIADRRRRHPGARRQASPSSLQYRPAGDRRGPAAAARVPEVEDLARSSAVGGRQGRCGCRRPPAHRRPVHQSRACQPGWSRRRGGPRSVLARHRDHRQTASPRCRECRTFSRSAPTAG